jgi:tetratricopeptide (TPR) repeat protein
VLFRSLGALAFLVPYLVISKIVFKGGDILAERWMYFPSLGLSFIAGYLLYSVYKRWKWAGITVLTVILITYAYVIIPRNQIWLSEENLRRSMVETAPQSIQGHYGLAQFYLENGYLKEAKQEAEIAYKIYAKHPPLLNTMGSLAFLEKDYDLAETHYLEAIEAAPFVMQSYQNAAKLYFTLGRYEEAESFLEHLVTNWSHPRDADFVDYALVLAKLGRYEESLEVIGRKFGENLDDPRVRLVLAIIHYKMGDFEEAQKYFDWSPDLSEGEKIRILREF